MKQSTAGVRKSLLQFNHGTAVISDGFIVQRRIYIGGKTFTSAYYRNALLRFLLAAGHQISNMLACM